VPGPPLSSKRPPFGPGGMLVRPDRCPIHEMRAPVKGPRCVRAGLYSREQPVPHPGVAPAPEPAVHGGPRPIPRRHVPPRRPRALPPQDPVEQPPVVVRRTPARGPLRGQQRGQHRPLLVGQRMAARAHPQDYPRRHPLCVQALEKDPINLELVVSSGTLEVLSLDGQSEQTTFVSLVEDLDDGEAATSAIAVHRRFGVATDDQKALKALRSANVRTYSTLDLVRMWCDVRALSAVEVATLLIDLRVRGSFLPPRGDSLRPWWDQRPGAAYPGTSQD